MELAGPKNNWHYNKKLKSLAWKHRYNMTKAEALLWDGVLKHRKLRGYGFRRQRPILNYIVDFMSKDLMLIIEVDGLTHQFEDGHENDNKRTKELESVGFTVLRFSDSEVYHEMDSVTQRLEWFIDEFENHFGVESTP